MKSTDDRALFAALVASSAASGNVETIPATQSTAGDGTASIALGFPPETFIARAAGGAPPRGADMNGFLNLFSRALRVVQTGFFGQFNANFAQAIGGYPSGAIVSGSVVGAFWVSTADDNTSTPGANGSTWKSLFDGYATQSWTTSSFVQNAGNIVAATMDASGVPSFKSSDGKWYPVQLKGDYAEVSDFACSWGSSGYIEIPTAQSWKMVQQWVQFQGVTGTGGSSNGCYETEDIFVTWPLGMKNLLSIPGLNVSDVGGVGMNEKVWTMSEPTETGGRFRLACNEAGVAMTGSAWIIGSVAA